MWLVSSHNHSNITGKLQNKYHSEPSEMELYGSPRTKELKKPHSSRWVGGMEGVETKNGLVPNPCVVDIKQKDISGARDLSPTPDHPVQGSSDKKVSLHNFWL